MCSHLAVCDSKTIGLLSLEWKAKHRCDYSSVRGLLPFQNKSPGSIRGIFNPHSWQFELWLLNFKEQLLGFIIPLQKHLHTRSSRRMKNLQSFCFTCTVQEVFTVPVIHERPNRAESRSKACSQVLKFTWLHSQTAGHTSQRRRDI